MNQYKITHRDKNNPNTNPLDDKYKVEYKNPFKNPTIITTKQIIENIEKGDEYYIVIDNNKTIVKVVKKTTGEKYITTMSDDTIDNNLLNLPPY
jgi:hypothetical protein